MEGLYRRLIIAGIILLIASTVISPVGAKISTSIDANYDEGSKTATYGEEIHVQITIRPGDSEVSNLYITISERDALIDDSSFKHTISPTGADVNVVRDGRSFHCEKLAPGESLILSFNAYPKTILQEVIHVADVSYEYIQLGDSVTDRDSVSVDTSGSFWFRYQEASSEKETSSTIFYIGIIFIIISIIIVVYQNKRNQQAIIAIQSEKNRKDELLKKVYDKIDISIENPTELTSLKTQINREIGGNKMRNSDAVKDKESIGLKKKSKFD